MVFSLSGFWVIDCCSYYFSPLIIFSAAAIRVGDCFPVVKEGAGVILECFYCSLHIRRVGCPGRRVSLYRGFTECVVGSGEGALGSDRS